MYACKLINISPSIYSLNKANSFLSKGIRGTRAWFNTFFTLDKPDCMHPQRR